MTPVELVLLAWLLGMSEVGSWFVRLLADVVKTGLDARHRHRLVCEYLTERSARTRSDDGDVAIMLPVRSRTNLRAAWAGLSNRRWFPHLGRCRGRPRRRRGWGRW
jgi:hypothetical protein